MPEDNILNETVEEPKPEPKYKVISVEKTEPPEGLPGNNWHHYVIGYGKSRIDGTKPGTKAAVTEHAENVAEDLNSRTGIGGGSTYAPRRTNASNVKTAPKPPAPEKKDYLNFYLICW